MKSIVVKSRTIGGLVFSPNVRVELLVRPALAGHGKHIAVGFRLVSGHVTSEVVWFEPRISALEICSNFKKSHRKSHGPSLLCKGGAKAFVETLPKLEEAHCSNESTAQILEQIAVQHLSEEVHRIVFDPYSLEDTAKVDVFIHYRKNCLSTSVEMNMLIPFVNQQCFCTHCSQIEELARDYILLDE